MVKEILPGIVAAAFVVGGVWGVFAAAPWGDEASMRQDALNEQLGDRVVRTRADMRTLVRALETYSIDWNRYPPSTTNTQSMAGKGLPVDMPSFQCTSGGSLTTPIAYISRFPSDRFSSEPDTPYAYLATENNFVVWSPGPDKKYDFDWTAFDMKTTTQSAEFVAAFTYDVTNGLMSQGDLWRSKYEEFSAMESMRARRERDGSQGSKTTNSSKPTDYGDSAFTKEPQAKAEETQRRMRAIATAMEAYRIDCNVFSPSTNDVSIVRKGRGAIWDVPTFESPRLTTPIAYLTKMPKDPFTTSGAYFAYTHFAGKPENWLLWSPGPDGEYDVNWTEFATEENPPSPEFIAKYRYDASNGIVSKGDIFRARSEMPRTGPDK